MSKISTAFECYNNKNLKVHARMHAPNGDGKQTCCNKREVLIGACSLQIPNSPNSKLNTSILVFRRAFINLTAKCNRITIRIGGIRSACIHARVVDRYCSFELSEQSGIGSERRRRRRQSVVLKHDHQEGKMRMVLLIYEILSKKIRARAHACGAEQLFDQLQTSAYTFTRFIA